MLHQDPLYTPIANPNLGFGIKGELKAPLHYPEFDQSTPPLEQYNGLSLGSSWSYAEFEDTCIKEYISLFCFLILCSDCSYR